MAWIKPVTDRQSNSRTTAEDMNRIAGNIRHCGGFPLKMYYSNVDIVKQSEWAYILFYTRQYDPTIEDSTRFDNLNKIEAALIKAHEIYPSNTLYPSDNLIIHGDDEEV